jgi:hypothetical protein
MNISSCDSNRFRPRTGRTDSGFFDAVHLCPASMQETVHSSAIARSLTVAALYFVVFQNRAATVRERAKMIE